MLPIPKLYSICKHKKNISNNVNVTDRDSIVAGCVLGPKMKWGRSGRSLGKG